MHDGSCIGLAAAVCWCHLLGMSCHWPFLRADGSADWHTIKNTQPAWFIHTSERQNKAKCTWAMQMKDEKATNDPMQVCIMQQFESNWENNWLSTLDLYFQPIELQQSNWEWPPYSLTAKHQSLPRYPQLTCPTFQYERAQSIGLMGEQRSGKLGKRCWFTVCLRNSKGKEKGCSDKSHWFFFLHLKQIASN